MATAIELQYEAAHEQEVSGHKATARALQASAQVFVTTRDYLLENRLTPAQRQAFENMLDEKLAATAQRVREQGFWSTAAGKATVVGVCIAGGGAVADLALQLIRLVHP